MKQSAIFNKTRLIGLLSIFILLWSIFYLIPDIFSSLFNTILGKSILLIVTIIIGFNNYLYGVIFFILLIIIYRTLHVKEGFEWQKNTTDKFILIQQTINPHVVFDTNQIKQQASQQELDYFIANGFWPWSRQVQELYKEAVMKNPYIRTDPQEAVNHARTIYNQSIISEMLSWQTKEGQFLLNGVGIYDGSNNPLEDLPSGWGNYGYESGLISKQKNNVIKCGLDASGNNTLMQTILTGKDGITGAQTKQTTPIDFNNLETIVPGFSFINDPCNPCVALDNPSNYSCPFKLELPNTNSKVSNTWQYLWGINTDPLQSLPAAITNNSKLDYNLFPILGELQNEINALFEQ